MYVVTGATGNTGTVVAQTLLKQGKQVKVVVRDANKAKALESAGAKITVANLDDTAALTQALQGAEGAYLMIPPAYGAEDYLAAEHKVADSVAKAVTDSGLPNAVLLSSIGAQRSSGTGVVLNLHYAENAIVPISKAITVIRPAYFMENFAPVLGVAASNGLLPSFLLPHRKIPMIDTEDIGRIAADLLLAPAQGQRVVEMAGPEEYSPEDAAAILSRLLNRNVQIHPMPTSAAEATLTQQGFTPDVARLFAGLFEGINNGRVSYEDPKAPHRRGTVTLEQALSKLLKTVTAKA